MSITITTTTGRIFGVLTTLTFLVSLITLYWAQPYFYLAQTVAFVFLSLTILSAR